MPIKLPTSSSVLFGVSVAETAKTEPFSFAMSVYLCVIPFAVLLRYYQCQFYTVTDNYLQQLACLNSIILILELRACNACRYYNLVSKRFYSGIDTFYMKKQRATHCAPHVRSQPSQYCLLSTTPFSLFLLTFVGLSNLCTVSESVNVRKQLFFTPSKTKTYHQGMNINFIDRIEINQYYISLVR